MFPRRLITAFFLLQCAMIGALKFGAWGAGRLECNTISYPAEVLPNAGPLRIAFFADVHNNRGLFDESVKKIVAAKPDLIVFGGDLIISYERFMRTRWAVEGFRKLAATAPVYAVLGNQDYEKQEQVERVLATAGVTLLRNEGADWQTPAGTTLRIIGLGDYNEGDEAPQRCMSRAGEEEKPVLLLSHDPESRWLLRSYDWDFMLSGHTHGGQLGIPFTGRCLSFRSSMPAGKFDFEGNRRVFVTRGVGAIFNMRFFSPPEVDIIDIGR